MKIKLCPAGAYQSNTYIIYDEDSLEALIIDPGDAPETVIGFLRKNSLQPVGIVLTHHHSDHVGAAEKIKAEYSCPISIHKEDEKGLKILGSHGLWNLIQPRIVINPDRFLTEGDTVTAGNVTLKVVHTPGHTPGSICLEVVGSNVVFTGDTIFANGIGRTDFPGGDQSKMVQSLCGKVNSWPDNYTICPGHGPTASMGEIRKYNGLFCSIIAHK